MQDPPSIPGFEVSERLEEGPLGSLWRARGERGPVLLRLYPRSAWPGAEGERLARGCALLEEVERPAVPHPVARGATGEAWFLAFPDPGTWTVLEHLHGQPLEPHEAAETLLQVAEGLEGAHALGLGARLDPGTLRIEPGTGRVHLLGLEAGAAGPGSEPLDDERRARDLRDLGTLLAVLMTGREAPPEGPALRRLVPDLPPPLEWTLSRLRRAGTPEGYREAGAVASDLEAWLTRPAEPAPEVRPAPSPGWDEVWAEVEAEPPARPAPGRRGPALAVLALVLAWLAWLVGGPWLAAPPEEPGELPPDELVESAPEEPGAAPLDPGRGLLVVEVRGLRPPSTSVDLKIREGKKVLVEKELEAGRGRVEVPRGRLLTVELSADLHTPRSRSVLLEEGAGNLTLRTVLVRVAEVTISTAPGARVTLDSRPAGQADDRGLLNLPPGSLEIGRMCLVSASKVGYETREEPFTVKKGHTVVHLDLAPSQGPRPPGAPPPAAGLLPPAPPPPSGPWPGPLPAPPPAPPPGSAPGPPPPPTRVRPAAPAPAPAPAAPPAPPAPRPAVPAPAVQAPAVPPPAAPSGGSELPVLQPDN